MNSDLQSSYFPANFLGGQDLWSKVSLTVSFHHKAYVLDEQVDRLVGISQCYNSVLIPIKACVCCTPWMLSICPSFSAAPLTLHKVLTMRSALASDRKGLESRTPFLLSSAQNKKNIIDMTVQKNAGRLHQEALRTRKALWECWPSIFVTYTKDSHPEH